LQLGSDEVFPEREAYCALALPSVLTEGNSNCYTRGIMTIRDIEPPSSAEVCARVRHLGYAVSGRVRLYGEELEVVSDPFPDADGIAIRVTSKKNSTVRVVRLPATVLQCVRGRAHRAA
jgi:hypothetical protein